MYVQLTVFVIILLVLCVNILYVVTKLNYTEKKATSLLNGDMELSYHQNGLVNCTHTRLPCIVTQQCLDNCASFNMINNMECDQGFCTIREAQSSSNNDNDIECDATKGLIKVFTASEFVINQLCISTYRDVFDDDGQLRPYICENGTVDIDVLNRPFSVTDCECAPGYKRMIFQQTALARTVPVCIPNTAVALYSKIYQ